MHVELRLCCCGRYWAIAIPSAIFVAASTAILVYIAVNFMSTAPLDSFDTITGNCHIPGIELNRVRTYFIKRSYDIEVRRTLIFYIPNNQPGRSELVQDRVILRAV